MRLVVIESPFAGGWLRRWLNVRYARRCMRDSLRRNEAPLASHLLYPQVLDDATDAERRQGIEAGLAWGWWANDTVVYVDRGITPGMELGMRRAKAEGRGIVWRALTPRGVRRLEALVAASAAQRGAPVRSSPGGLSQPGSPRTSGL